MNTTTRDNGSSNFAATNKLEEGVQRASTSAHAAVNSVALAADEAARKAKPAIERVAAMAHDAVDTAAGAATPTAEWLSKQGENLNATQEKLVSDTCAYISANPLKAVGIALATGFIISRLIA
jgi:ElaB/YqjD/DUF883 family membrane-anchored ribosome-binding protein